MSDIQRVKGSQRSHLQRGNSVSAVIDWAGGTREVENVIHLTQIERLADILFDEFEAGLVAQVGEIGMPASKHVIDCDNTPAVGQQGVT
jgi:hypothetical protein